MSNISEESCVGGTIFLANHQQLNNCISFMTTYKFNIGRDFFHQGASLQGFLANQQCLLLNVCFLDNVNTSWGVALPH